LRLSMVQWLSAGDCLFCNNLGIAPFHESYGKAKGGVQCVMLGVSDRWITRRDIICGVQEC